jgi:HEAT repeat protein
MLTLADTFVALLRPFLFVSALALAAMFVFLIVQRGVDELLFRRRQRITAKYRDVVNALMGPDDAESALITLARAPNAHRPVIESMLLKPLAVATGTVVDQLRHAARVLNLIDEWARRLSDRRWWVRADAARSLGLVREPRALEALSRLLEDDHEEVRAAAVEALGLIGHPQAIPLLLSRLADQSRHQRARIVEALREFGDVATPALAAHAENHPDDAVVVADVLGLIGGTAASESLKAWAQNERAELRTAALRGLGTIGLDDVSARLARHALDDEHIPVRAAAARALGRAHRHEAAPDLARHLDDDWTVAANCADALRRIGRAGLTLLQARVSDESYAGDLARQMLWERSQAGVW